MGTRLEWLVRALTIYSLVMLFVELEVAPNGASTGFFLWSERVVAAAFTIEYVARWIASRSWRFPLQPMAIVDLLCVLPFYLGFFIDPDSLRFVRVLRVVRLLKLDRDGAAASSLFRAFYRIRHEIKLVTVAGLMVGMAATVAVFEFEHDAQPEQFARASDALWYVLATVTTVGYGDRVPVTYEGRAVGAIVMLSGLILFGTFVSLVGSAFVEEIRKRTDHAPIIASIPRGATEVARRSEQNVP